MRSASCWRSRPARRCWRCRLFHTGPGEYVAAVFYVVSLLTVLSISLAYNLWPLTPAKWMLRRFDHAAIYLLIAATYTPFLAQLDDAALGGLDDRGRLGRGGRRHGDQAASCPAASTGWPWSSISPSAGAASSSCRPLLDTLPPSDAVAASLAGGIVYSCGVVFFAWHRLRFQNAVWHGFVVVGAGLHFAAVMDCLVIARL